MAKLKLFANEYSGLLTIIGIFLVLLINGITATYVITNVQVTQESQTKTLADVVTNLGDVTKQVGIITDWMGDMQIEHNQLMNKNNIPPLRYQQLSRTSNMKPFPR